LTEKKLAQLALEDSERRQRIALDSAQMGTWDWIIGTSRLTWDINQLRIFGFPPGGFDSTIESFIQRVYPEDLAHVQEVLHRASQGHDFAMEFRIIRHNDGAVRWIYGSGVVVHTDNGIPFKFVGINFDITERKVAEEFLRKSLKEKDAMLREIHHRVKNNLQVITSLLNLQNSRVANQELKRLIQESQDRIQAMALVHEMLYRSQNLAEIDLPKYLSELAQYLLRAYGNPGVEIDLQLQLSPAYIGLEKMIPCGLLVNEVITNSLKYAFLGRQRGVISLELAEDAGQIHLVIADDGVGMSQALEDQVSTTLGSKLILVLVEQLGANLEVHTDPGTRYSLKFQG
jgi:two-component sensor histidine kinase